MSTSIVNTLNALLRGEIAAAETYQQALEKIDTHPAVAELRCIHGEHREAAHALRQHVYVSGGDPDQDSGAWGAFAKIIEGAAQLFGRTAALKALKEGEEHGADAYQDALFDPDILPEDRAMISQLLRRTRAHIATLDRLMRQLSNARVSSQWRRGTALERIARYH